MKRKALGRGLDSLIPKKPAAARSEAAATKAPADPGILEIDLDRIRPNRAQPRKQFDPEALAELAVSLETAGVIQPVVVRPVDGERYELIAGERRWRAAQQAGLLKIPAVVKHVPDERMLETALIENVQREELNAIEEALAYHTLIEDLDLTQAEVADRVGKNRVTVSNALRLLTLARAVQDAVRAGTISAGHGRALAGLSNPSDQVRLAQRIEREQLSVRDVERIVARAARESTPAGDRRKARRDPNVEAAETRLQEILGTKVRIVQGRKKGSGRLELYYYSDEELSGLYDLLEQTGRPGR